VDASNLPLLELFTRLQDAGFPLGIDEYKLLVNSLQGGFGISDKAALKRLCQTLWVKNSEEKRLFAYHFEHLFPSDGISFTSETQPHKSRIPQIIRYLILGILEVGIVFGLVSTPKQQNLQKITTSPKPSLPSNQNPTPGQLNLTPIPNVQPTVIPSTNTNINQPGLIWRMISSVIFISAGCLILRLGNKKNLTKNPVEDSSTPDLTADLSIELTQAMSDEIQVAQAVRQITNKDTENPQNIFISSEYFPVTQRQMKQIWRYFRRPVRQGLATELDIEATVRQIGRQGIFIEPIFISPRVNRASVIILIDQDGSMVPFHSLSMRLAETAIRGGRLGKASVYYFHNCPKEYLYEDTYHQNAIPINDIFHADFEKQTTVLIFSDAGASRGGYSWERYQLTQHFLKKLQQRVQYIAWLNPMPKKRWLDTTAGEIANLIPMFEISIRGLQNAIGVLRGRLR
jgi:uncharacterized protein